MNTFTCSWMHLCATYTARPFWVHWIMTEGAQTSRLGLYTHTGAEVDEVQTYVHNSEGTVGMSIILEDRFLCHFLMTNTSISNESLSVQSMCVGSCLQHLFMSSCITNQFWSHCIEWQAYWLPMDHSCVVLCDLVYVCISWPFNVGSDLQLTQQSTRS